MHWHNKFIIFIIIISINIIIFIISNLILIDFLHIFIHILYSVYTRDFEHDVTLVETGYFPLTQVELFSWVTVQTQNLVQRFRTLYFMPFIILHVSYQVPNLVIRVHVMLEWLLNFRDVFVQHVVQTVWISLVDYIDISLFYLVLDGVPVPMLAELAWTLVLIVFPHFLLQVI